MSKLFETLEQIRRHESPETVTPDKAAKKPVKPKTKRLRIIIPSALIAGIIVAAFFLFPTLQEILPQKTAAVLKKKAATQETTQAPTHDVISEPQTQKTPVLAQKPKTDTTSTSHQVTQPKPVLPAKDNIKTKSEFVALNNRGTELIVMGQHWDGISILNQAHQLQPDRIEPLLNIAVGLAELGLYGPATRYFMEAKKIAPQHPQLQENMKILRQAGLLDLTL